MLFSNIQIKATIHKCYALSVALRFWHIFALKSLFIQDVLVWVFISTDKLTLNYEEENSKDDRPGSCQACRIQMVHIQ